MMRQRVAVLTNCVTALPQMLSRNCTAPNVRGQNSLKTSASQGIQPSCTVLKNGGGPGLSWAPTASALFTCARLFPA